MNVHALTVGPFASNCYIVVSEGTGEAMVIDPGAEGGRVMRSIESLGVNVKLIVATHGHSDHTGAVARVRESTQAPFAIHSQDARIPGQRTGIVGAVMGTTHKPADTPDRLLKEDDAIDFGGLSFKVLHTPGHTPGGICLAGQNTVFSGDTLFNYGIGRTDFPGGSYEQLMESIAGKLLSLPDETVVYPGHGPETTIGDERRHNPFILEYLRYRR